MTIDSLLTVEIFSRPKRVAFLLDPQNTKHEDFNEIIRYCSATWGGRFHAIVPCDGNSISNNWWELLLAYDPDIICTFVKISPDLKKHIFNDITPARFVDLLFSSPQVITISLNTLGIYGIPEYLMETRIFDSSSILCLKDSGLDDFTQSFIMQNFGVLPNDINTKKSFEKINHEHIESKDLDANKILTKYDIGKTRNIIYPIELSEIFSSSGFTLDNDQRITGFHLVVGDTIMDRIYAWNRKLISNLNCGRDVLWLPTSLCEDSVQLEAVRNWINYAYNGDQSGSDGKVISYSENEVDLKRVAEVVQKNSFICGGFKPLRLSKDEFPIPKTYSTIANRSLSDLKIPSSFLQQQVGTSRGNSLVKFPNPSFLKQRGLEARSGWIVEARIEYQQDDYGRISNNHQVSWWRLPQKLDLAELFFKDYTSAARITKDGFPCVEVMNEQNVIELSIPSNQVVIANLLSSNGANVQSKSKFIIQETSDKGKYLEGALQLFGGLVNADFLLSDIFTRKVLSLMCGMRNYDETIENATQKLEATFKRAGVECINKAKIEEVATILVDQNSFYKDKSNCFTLGELKNHFCKWKGKDLKEQKNLDYWKNVSFDDWQQHQLPELIDDQILLQGGSLRCPNCLITRWYVVEELKTKILCNGCLSSFSLPVNPAWQFQLNHLLRDAFAKHGVFNVIDALNYYHLFNRMFLFVPTKNIYERSKIEKSQGSKGCEVYTDLDLIFITNGKLFIGEVKTNPKLFNNEDMDKLYQIAIDMRPNVVVLAASGNCWPNEIIDKVNTLKAKLSPKGIQVETLFLIN